MNKDLRDNLLRNLSEDTKNAFLDLLEEKIMEIGDLERNKPSEWSEVVGREWAIKKMRDMFKFLNPNQPSKEAKKENYL